jgi:predicted kinase
VVVVMGRVATGKSTLAAALGAETGWEVVSSDRTRKQLAGVPPGRRGTGGERRRLYSEAMTARTYSQLAQRAVDAAGEGTGLVLDATYGRPGQREALRDRLAARGIPLRFIELAAPDAVIKGRLEARGGRAGEVSDARLGDFEMLGARHEPPTELDRRFHLRLGGDGRLSEMLGRALRWVAVVQARHPTPFPPGTMSGSRPAA